MPMTSDPPVQRACEQLAILTVSSDDDRSLHRLTISISRQREHHLPAMI